MHVAFTTVSFVPAPNTSITNIVLPTHLFRFPVHVSRQSPGVLYHNKLIRSISLDIINAKETSQNDYSSEISREYAST